MSTGGMFPKGGAPINHWPAGSSPSFPSSGGGGGSCDLSGIEATLAAMQVTLAGMESKIADLHDDAFGTWTLDPTGKTLTLRRANGTVFKVFDLLSTNLTVPSFIQRTPR